jgi:uncharacterized protein YjbJ (UPF0337 family)
MAEQPSRSEEPIVGEQAVKGVVEGAKGKAKEAVGIATGRDDLIREGKSQQGKADAERDVAKKEAEAQQARRDAETQERRQQADQSDE